MWRSLPCSTEKSASNWLRSTFRRNDGTSRCGVERCMRVKADLDLEEGQGPIVEDVLAHIVCPQLLG